MSQSEHWADVIASKIGTGKNIIATGITPSGPIHLGNMREVLTGDAIFRALKDSKGDARLIYIADTYDPLRKLYPFLEEGFTQYIGFPLIDCPDPFGCCDSYADHFLAPFLESMNELAIYPEVLNVYDLYESGAYDEMIIESLKKRDQIAKIIYEVSGKEVPSEWSPYNVRCDGCGRLTGTSVLGIVSHMKVDYSCDCGYSGCKPIRGGGKLSWRVDWPARWKILGVTVEPFGKDHASSGGSYDTGKRISEEVFDYPAPFPVVYEWINLKGKGPMSSSKGITISINDMLLSVPPELLRFFILRTKPEKHIDFDPGMPVLNLFDEYDGSKGERLYELSGVQPHEGKNVPFRHLVSLVQIAGDDDDFLLSILERTGFEFDRDAVVRRSGYVRDWLMRFAPEAVKFEVKKELPEEAASIGEKERNGLGILSELLTEEWGAKELHTEIYGISEKLSVPASKLFQAIYLAVLGKKSGPKAAYFLLSLDRTFVIERFKEVAEG